MDQAFKAYTKVRKNQITNSVFKKAMTHIGDVDMRQNKLDYLLLAKQVDTLCSQVSDYGISNDEPTAATSQ